MAGQLDTSKIMAALDRIADRLGRGHVAVGFMENATYPDGELVAGVAAKNEFGDPANHQPPRPFFRQMIAKEKPTWSDKVAKLAKATDYDGPRILGLMGEDIKGALQQSINDLTDPPLAAKTIELKGFEKPLIETSHMLNSVAVEVHDD